VVAPGAGREDDAVSSDIGQLESAALVVNDDTPPEVCVEILSKLDGLKARIRDAEAVIKGRMVEYCLSTGRRIELGDGSYWYAGSESQTTCLDKAATLEALLEANGGDVRGLADVIASNGIKHGAAGKLLEPEVYHRLFKVEVKDKLKRVLLKADPKYLK
jgi:hypothetical protein